MTDTSKPWAQHTIRTTFLRVPLTDWAAITRGFKTEFRSKGREAGQFWRLQCPTPVVGYVQRKGASRQTSRLLVLEATWMETLQAITAESLEREGFQDFPSFRRYWMMRHSKRFEPLMQVRVYRVRPFQPKDRDAMAHVLLDRLYGEFLT